MKNSFSRCSFKQQNIYICRRIDKKTNKKDKQCQMCFSMFFLSLCLKKASTLLFSLFLAKSFCAVYAYWWDSVFDSDLTRSQPLSIEMIYRLLSVSAIFRHFPLLRVVEVRNKNCFIYSRIHWQKFCFR